MFRKLISYSISDKEFNEDTFAYGDNFLLVIDGATGLGFNNHLKVGDDAYWFANQIKDQIVSHINENIELQDLVKNAIEEVRKSYLFDVPKIDTPSACIALFRIRNNLLEYFGLGDTLGIVETKDGMEIFCDERLEAYDNAVKRRMQVLSKDLNIPFLETRNLREIEDMLIANRNKRNEENGYYSLDLTTLSIEHAMTKKWKIEDVIRFCGMSDGFSEVLEYPIYNTMKEVLDAIEENHTKIEEELYNIQNEDASCTLVPRFKLRDDTTYVFAKL